MLPSDPDASPAGWLQAVQTVLEAVAASDVSELDLRSEQTGFAVRLRRKVGARVSPGLAGPAGVASETADADAGLHRVVAPLTGVFYRAASPTAKPYVDEGEWVEPEAVVGLIETMKIFNEVTVEVGGRIVRFLADTGQLVHTGDPLLLLEPGQRSAAASELGV